MPVGEHVLPPFYANPGANHPNIPSDPCSPNGEEEFGYNFESAPGLDNDGDGVYGPVDSDCVQAGPCDGFVAEPTACGVGECSSTGTSTCTEVNGEAVFGDTCTPSAGSTEICDGLDNDCDGTPDDGIADMFTGTDVGECRAEVSSCTGGSFQVVQSGIGSQPEVCDGLDNDCDGQVDNGIAATPTTCGTGDCAATGQLACVNGGMVDNCTQGAPGVETCDQQDNNCNGAIDEGDVCVTIGACDTFTEEVTTCGTGECAATGMTTCTDVVGQPLIGDSCAPGTPSAEICDQLDNDCDGAVDEGGVCDPVCVPAAEVCDGIDNDCDGVVDEDGVCDPVCVPADEVCDGIDNNCDGMVDEGGVCDPVCVPTAEVCDGIDNNCDGMVDEGDVCAPTPGPGDEDDSHDSDDEVDDDGFNSPPSHTDMEGGFLHAPGKDKPFSNSCTDCHGSKLTGPDSGGFAPSCFTCHGKEWDEDAPGPKHDRDDRGKGGKRSRR
ncbi:MAG: MopE-related protein [Deferrisomatales bacterium]|nr:MopE-related protein [Deferrisomatales bacterium]